MSVTLKQPVHGLNSDLYMTRLPSGTADIALNVTVREGEIKRREGFGVYMSALPAGASVDQIFTAAFASGTTKVIARHGADLYQVTANAPVAIVTTATHTGVGGWGFTWADRFHYFDTGGGSRWNPTVHVGVAYKAGLPQPTTAMHLVSATGYAKNGRYHATYALKNSITEEEGVIGLTEVPSVETLLESGAGHGALAISNLSGNTDYECDTYAFYCSTGNSEYVSLGSGGYIHSWRMYKESEGTIVSPPAGLGRADSTLDPRDQFTNAGGEPPAAAIGCFTGSRAVYGQVWESAALVPALICYSIPNFPTSVPKRVYYALADTEVGHPHSAGYAHTVDPTPYEGRIRGGVPGEILSMVYAGGMILCLTGDSTWKLIEGGDGRLYPKLLHPSIGCESNALVVGTPWSAHVIGENTWFVMNQGGVMDIAIHRFATLLSDNTPAVAAYYSYRDQVWVACSRKIYVLDLAMQATRGGGELTCFEPACLTERATVTTNGMCFTARAAGTAGNSIDIVLVSGTALSVSVAGDVITINFIADKTTVADVIAAVAASTDASALIICNVQYDRDETNTIPAAAAGTYDLAGGTAGATITSMAEFAEPGNTPVMLVGLSDGQILKYPSGLTDNQTNFAAQWRGYFAQERYDSSQRAITLESHAGENVGGNVLMGIRPMRTPADTVGQQTKVLSKSSGLESHMTIFSKIDGRLFQVEFVSDQQSADAWSIRDLVWKLDKK